MYMYMYMFIYIYIYMYRKRRVPATTEAEVGSSPVNVSDARPVSVNTTCLGLSG